MQIEIECAKLTCEAPPPPSGAASWCSCCYGGATARPQLEALAMGVEILVATPGRLCDFMGRDLVSLSNCRFLVLDEADRMLDMGFEPQIRRIVERADLPPKHQRQTMLFSATFAPAIQQVAREYLREPFAHVEVGKVGESISSISQRLVLSRGASKQSKLALLKPLLTPGERTIVFVQKKHVASWVTGQLSQAGVVCGEIHGDRTQGQREAALRRFREGAIEVLVATDVASRGIDVPEVAHVIQFDLPVSRDEMDSYVHRIGRTGRAGRSGRSTAFFVPGFEPKLGNGFLWPDLARLFDDNGQELPSWFDDCRPQGAMPRAVRRDAADGTPQPTDSPPQSNRRRGASDNRRARRAAAAATAGRLPNMGPPGGRVARAAPPRRSESPSMMAISMALLPFGDGDYDEGYDEVDEARDLQALVPFLIQLLPIGALYVLGTALLPALAWPLGLAVVALLVAANTFDEDD
jgi:ATP-dependent RNA helicase DDX3X